MLPSHNEGFEKFETENEILTSCINFLNIIRLYFFSGAGREMLTCIAIFKVVSFLMSISKFLPDQLLLIVSFSLECWILFHRTNDPTIQFLLISSFVSVWVIFFLIWFIRFLRFRRMRIYSSIRLSDYIDYIKSIFSSVEREFYRLIVIFVVLLMFGFCFDFFIYNFMIIMTFLLIYDFLVITAAPIMFSNIFICFIPIMIYVGILILLSGVKNFIRYSLVLISFFTSIPYYKYIPALYLQYTMYLVVKFAIGSMNFVFLLWDALFVLSPFPEKF